MGGPRSSFSSDQYSAPSQVKSQLKRQFRHKRNHPLTHPLSHPLSAHSVTNSVKNSNIHSAIHSSTHPISPFLHWEVLAKRVLRLWGRSVCGSDGSKRVWWCWIEACRCWIETCAGDGSKRVWRCWVACVLRFSRDFISLCLLVDVG